MDKVKLAKDLKDLFAAASADDGNTFKPDGEEMSKRLATVIADFVATCEVKGLTVQVKNVAGDTVIGNGLQNNTVKVV
jgi:hypothetical protein